MGIGDIFGATFQDYKKNFKLVLQAFWWFNVLPILIFGFIVFVGALFFLSSASQFISQDEMNLTEVDFVSLTGNAIKDSGETILLAYGVLFVILLVIFAIVISVFTILLYTTIYSIVTSKEKNLEFREAAKTGARYFWRYLGLNTLIFLIIFLLFVPGFLSIFLDIGLWELLNTGLKVFFVLLSIALFIGAFVLMVYLSIAWVFAPYALIGEDKRIVESMRISKELTKGRWWRVFGYLLLVALLSFAVSMFFSIPNLFISFFFNMASTLMAAEGNLIGAGILFFVRVGFEYLFNLAATIVLTPFAVSFFKHLYFELKTEKMKR